MREKSDNTGIDIRSFAEKVSRAVSKRLGGTYEVKLQEVTKNNGVILQGLVILTKNRNVSPTIYLNSFLSDYEEGMTLTEIVHEILRMYKKTSPRGNIDMSFFREFESVQDRICYRLLNRGKNRVLLERIPHIDFLDLSICFYYAYRSNALGTGTILIHNNHVEMWGCTTEDLMRLAEQNTPRLFPGRMRSMEEVVMELAGAGLAKKGVRPLEPEVSMQILSNSEGVHGAIAILYPGLLKSLSKELGGNFYILPSSIHETILLEESGAEDEELLRSTVCEVNATQVEPEEVLSDNLYYYDCFEDKVRMV